MSIKEEIKPFLDAKSVAIIGASRRTGPGAFNVMENMMEFGYKGDIYPVNPKADEVLGTEAYSDIREIQDDVDHAVIAIPRRFVADALKGCVEQGIPAITIVSQGFADVGGKGVEMQDELVEIVKGTGSRIVGPNTLGSHNYVDNFTTSFIPFEQRDYDPIASVSQTGLWMAGFPELMYAKALDVGNACDVDHVDALRYFIEDPDIEQIFLHMEGLRPGRGEEFAEAAKEAREKGKQIMAFKTAGSKLGREAAATHTGSLAGEDEIFDGAFRQLGIVRVRDYSETQAISKALLKLPRMDGNRIGMITHHGASGIMAYDAAEEFGLRLAKISDETIKTVEELSPEWLPIKNPIDVWPGLMGGPEKMHEVSHKAALEDENVDGLLVSIHIADPTSWPLGIYGHIDAIKKYAPKYDKPVIVVPVGTEQRETREELEEIKNTAVLDDVRSAMKAFSVLASLPQGKG